MKGLPDRTTWLRSVIVVAMLGPGLVACESPAPLAQATPTTPSLISPLAPTGAMTALSATPPRAPAATERVASHDTPTPQQIRDIFPPGTPGRTAVPLPPAQQLVNSLAAAEAEMRAAQASPDLAGARRHAEAVVNILVGYWGQGYGDGDGDGTINDPTDGYGVLPAGRVQEAAPDTRAGRVQLGWALEVYQGADPSTRHEIEQFILGDAQAWSERPFARYDEINQAVAHATPDGKAIDKLDSPVMRAAAWARLILSRAGSPGEAQAEASRGLAEIETALQAARRIAGTHG